MSEGVLKDPARARAAATMGADDAVTCDLAQVTREAATRQLVGDVMLRHPKTLPGNTRVDQARRFFEDSKVISALIVDGTAFVGLLERSDLPSLLPGTSPVRTFVRREIATITPDRPVSEAVDILDAGGLARLVVLESDGVTLAGLLCLDRKRAGFCQG